jgi:hypothetical protein
MRIRPAKIAVCLHSGVAAAKLLDHTIYHYMSVVSSLCGKIAAEFKSVSETKVFVISMLE